MKALLIIVILVVNGSQTSMTSITETLPTMAACQTVLPIVEKELANNATTQFQNTNTKIVPLVTKCVRIE